MDAYGRHFIATVDDTAAGSPLHWTVRPFWHDLSVQVHADGISVTARDDLPAAARPMLADVPGGAGGSLPVAQRPDPAAVAA